MIEVIGHRGAAGIEPENTLRSMKKAIDLGVDRIEIDVRVTKDKRLVVVHDETVDRTTNGQGYVKELAFDELRKLDAGKGEKIPTLEEALELTRGKVMLQIELKAMEATDLVVHLIEEMKAEKDVVITSFMQEALERVHELKPNLKTGFLASGPREDVLQKAIAAHCDAVHVSYRNIDPKLIEEARNKGLRIAATNPDNKEDMDRMIEMGIDIIGSNRPDILIDLLKSKGLR